MTTIEEVEKIHKEICQDALNLVSTKGHDYNREQQKNGDTLHNLTVGEFLGIGSTTSGILWRMSDKLMRLVSLTKDPSVQNEVKDESVRDTVRDNINYSVYLYIKYMEARKKLESEGTGITVKN